MFRFFSSERVIGNFEYVYFGLWFFRFFFEGREGFDYMRVVSLYRGIFFGKVRFFGRYVY